jgi:hypothetical protein
MEGSFSFLPSVFIWRCHAKIQAGKGKTVMLPRNAFFEAGKTTAADGWTFMRQLASAKNEQKQRVEEILS